MNKNIEKNQISNWLKEEQYWKENIDFINKNPEIAKIIPFFNLKNNTKNFSTMKNFLDKVMVIDNSTKKLQELKDKLV
jgi:hypothetical protein